MYRAEGSLPAPKTQVQPGAPTLKHSPDSCPNPQVRFPHSESNVKSPLQGLQTQHLQSTGWQWLCAQMCEWKGDVLHGSPHPCLVVHTERQNRRAACQQPCLRAISCHTCLRKPQLYSRIMWIWSKAEKRKYKAHFGFPEDIGETNSF